VAEVGLAAGQAVMLTRGPDRIRLPLGVLPVVAVAAAAAAAAGLGLGLGPVLGTLLASGVFFAVLRLLGRFPDEARDLLRGRVSAGFGAS
jgi:hypothetical protein